MNSHYVRRIHTICDEFTPYAMNSHQVTRLVADLPHMKWSCVAEMTARALKHLMRALLASSACKQSTAMAAATLAAGLNAVVAVGVVLAPRFNGRRVGRSGGVPRDVRCALALRILPHGAPAAAHRALVSSLLLSVVLLSVFFFLLPFLLILLLR